MFVSIWLCLFPFGCVCFHSVVFVLYISRAEGKGETAFDILPSLDMFGCILVVFLPLFVVFKSKYLERIEETASGISSLPIQEDLLIFKSLTVGNCAVANNATGNFEGMKS